MSFVTLDEVQQWLETTKLGVIEVDVELEDSASIYIFARVADVIDTSTWVDEATTPKLIRKLISMLVAAWIYERTYSESVPDQPTWAQRLEGMVEAILNGINAGSILLTDVPDVSSRDTEPAFWPTNATGQEQQYDAAGNEIGRDQNSEDIKFTMGVVF